MVKKGDTLIEVALAVGIFSMIAISIVSVMSSGTSGAQLSLETTLAREEIDAQAETLRFIHNAYSSNKENTDQALPNLWKTITANAISFDDESDEEEQEAILQYSPQTCDEIYKEQDNPIYNYAFVINPRMVNEDSEANPGAYVSLKDNSDILTSASTYPRLIFGDNEANSINSSSLFANQNDKSLYKAEGIYVIAVKDSMGTNIIDIADANDGLVSAYYDFYIRTCWYGTGNNEPSTISTVIRLHDSDTTAISGYVDVTINGERASRKRTYKLPEPATKKYAYTFKGWCPIEYADDNHQSCSKTPYQAGDTLYNNTTDGVIEYNLVEIWEHTKYTIKYFSDHGGEVPADTICYLDEDCYLSDADLKTTGYKLRSWCKKNESGYCSLSLTPGQLIKKAGEDNPSTILPGEFNSNKTLELHADWSEFNEKITLTLTWGETPRDLDSHINGQKSNGLYFETYYGNKTYSENFSEPIASLDKDVTSGYGPETITLNTLGGKTYYYYIYNWSGENSNVTGATVKLVNQTTGEERIYTSDSASGSGRYWNVFAYKDGKIINRNTRSSSAEINY